MELSLSSQTSSITSERSLLEWVYGSDRAAHLSRSSRKRRRHGRKRNQERKAKRGVRRVAREEQIRAIESFGCFVNLLGAELLMPRAKVRCP